MEIKKINIDELLPTEENPNVMADNKFNILVKTIEEVGEDQPLKVWWNEEKKKYEIVKGNHRYWALKLLGKTETECVIGEYKSRDEMLKDMVRDNMVRGELDPLKFTKLYDKISEKYGKDIAKEMFSFLEEKELKRLYKVVKESLPAELKSKLEEAKEEIKTIDDLSIVLNRLFAEYGNTLQFNFMIFSYAKWEELIYVRCNKENWSKIREVAKYCVDNKKDINEVIKINYDKTVE
jgi:ParB/RepB/Spo0J family partition protein